MTVGTRSTCWTTSPSFRPAAALSGHFTRNGTWSCSWYRGLSMPPPPVVFELLSVVRHEDDERVLIEPLLSQIVEESSQLAIHIANLLVVELEELFTGRGVGRDLAPRYILPALLT